MKNVLRSMISQGSIAIKHLRCDVLRYDTFIILFAGERIFKIGEHLAKLRTKLLIASCAPFAKRFPKRRRTRHISRITCAWRTETVSNCCCVNGQIHLPLLSTEIKLLDQFWLIILFNHCGTVVERRSLAGELSLSCARPAADGWPLMWVSHPL